MSLRVAGRRATWHVAAWAEQEVRAHPKAYDAFYGVITQSDRARAVIGYVRLRVRGRNATPPAALRRTDSALVVRRWESAVAARLGVLADPPR